jgi:hypothetical protein
LAARLEKARRHHKQAAVELNQAITILLDAPPG